MVLFARSVRDGSNARCRISLATSIASLPRTPTGAFHATSSELSHPSARRCRRVRAPLPRDDFALSDDTGTLGDVSGRSGSGRWRTAGAYARHWLRIRRSTMNVSWGGLPLRPDVIATFTIGVVLPHAGPLTWDGPFMTGLPPGFRALVVAQVAQQDEAIKRDSSCTAFQVDPLTFRRPRFMDHRPSSSAQRITDSRSCWRRILAPWLVSDLGAHTGFRELFRTIMILCRLRRKSLDTADEVLGLGLWRLCWAYSALDGRAGQ